jgi:hypothetical protein
MTTPAFFHEAPSEELTGVKEQYTPWRDCAAYPLGGARSGKRPE